MAIQIANGKKPNNINDETENGMVKVPSCLLEPVVIDKANLRDIIVKGGVFTEQEVFGIGEL
jgi:D-xylose transport system substrate-binding protein